MQLKRFLKFFIVCAISIIILAGCGNSENLDAGVSTQVAHLAPSIGTEGRLIAIQSDNVAAAGYDVNSKIMTVQFKNGYLYEYYGISEELWNSFIAAQPHPWSKVGYPQLVQAGVPYKRIS
jgi:hypothetical protein